MARFDLSDEEWSVICPLLPKQGRGPARKDDRKILNGIFYILHTGAPWRDLPERYGPRTTVYNRYVRWGERFFCKMKDMRRRATRFEKTAQNFPSMIQLFAITYVFEMRSVDVTMPSFASVVEAGLEVSGPMVIEVRENAGWLR